MQIIVNCLVRWRGGIVMLHKPRRGLWFLPGGKVEPGESWPDAVRREVWEETGLRLGRVTLCGVHVLVTAPGPGREAVYRTLAQFAGEAAGGELLAVSKEGEVKVIREEQIARLPMDEGDRIMLEHTLRAAASGGVVWFGRFEYGWDEQLVRWRAEMGA
ncbi:hypothetical protein GCM10010885_13680 [Alicyclobacillus cellulosilyticus]|uniref:Nudix hydrolase domain-containing protein n=1 Tax=Alicyclobacillus cellulosilyticus TaxID=1003997 RepID=A0A917KBJ8_9BACL|nr:NUDIX domain-containing protein [Alicyclobacillus cellulosilyticus]GGJ05787.1 hypothetical protein GCM10010885_13680 [Alicyclobacillus cellulosilyticus]